MTDDTRARLQGVYDATVDRLAYLYGRWLDEREYEDFSDYEAAIRAAVPGGVTVTQVIRRPFGFRFTIGDGAVYQMAVTTTRAAIKIIRRAA